MLTLSAWYSGWPDGSPLLKQKYTILNMRKLYGLLLFACCCATGLQAQQRLELPKIDALGYDSYGSVFDLYTKIGDGLYSRGTLRIMYQSPKVDKSSRLNCIDWYVTENEDTVTMGKILSEKKTIIDARDLRTVSIGDYAGKTFDVGEQGKWKREREETSVILKFLSHDIASVQEVKYEKGEGYGMRYPSSAVIPDSLQAWRVKYAWHYWPLELELKGGKRIILLTGSGYGYALIPDKKGDRLVKFSSGDKPAGLTAAGHKYDDTRADDFYMFYTKRFYGVQRAADGKCRLINTFKKDVLGTAYDSIAYDSRLIVCKRNDSIDVYNLYLKKLDLGRLVEAKELTGYTTGCIEALTTEGPAYYSEMGQRILKPEEIWYGVCGTVPDWTYTIERKGGKYRMRKYTSGPGVREERDETFLLADCKPGDSLTFMNGRSEYSFDGNSYFIDKMYLSPRLLKIQRNGKFGLVKYNYKQDDQVRPHKSVKNDDGYKRPLLTYPVQNIEGKVVLPVDNDSIVHSNDGLILFYKQGRIGIFPRHEQPVYDELKQQTKSYYRIVKNGKAGWLNIDTNREYFFKPQTER